MRKIHPTMSLHIYIFFFYLTIIFSVFSSAFLRKQYIYLIPILISANPCNVYIRTWAEITRGALSPPLNLSAKIRFSATLIPLIFKTILSPNNKLKHFWLFGYFLYLIEAKIHIFYLLFYSLKFSFLQDEVNGHI